jgi:hypothetical protein
MTGRAQQRRERHLPSQRQAAVRLHIGQLVLHGVPLGEAGAMTAALEAELTRLAAVPDQIFAHADARRVGPVHFVPDGAPDRKGRAVAAALWGGALSAGKD